MKQQQSSKRIIALLLSLAMIIGLCPLIPLVSAAVDGCGEDHGTHSGWTELTAATTALTDGGKYYLSGDLKLNGTVTVSGAVHLCLNGCTMTGAVAPYLSISNGATLKLCDCSAKASGAISGRTLENNTSDQGMVKINTGATVNMYGGTVSGYTTTASCGAFRVQGTFNLHNGLIAGNTAGRGGGMTISNGTFKMHGGQIGAENAPNQAQYGGAIYGSSNATIEINGGSICYNLAELKDDTTATAGGSAIYANATSTLTIKGGTISNNISRYNTSPQRYATIHGTGLTVNMSGGTIKDNIGIDANDTPVGAVAVYLQAASVNGGYAYPAANISGNPVVGDEGIVFKKNTENLNITALKKGASILSSATLKTSDGTVLTDTESVPGLKLYKHNPVLLSENFENYETGATTPDGGKLEDKDRLKIWTETGNSTTNYPTVIIPDENSGNKVLQIKDTEDDKSVQLTAYLTNNLTVGTELIATTDYYAVEKAAGNFQLLLRHIDTSNQNVSTTINADTIGRWDKMYAIQTITSTNQISLWLISNSAGKGTVYFDNPMLEVLTEELALKYLDEMLSATTPDKEDILSILQTKALSLVNFDADKIDSYIFTLKSAGTGLTKEAVQYCINNPSAAVTSVLFTEDFESYTVGTVALNGQLTRDGVDTWQVISNKTLEDVPEMVTPSISDAVYHTGTKSVLLDDRTANASMQFLMPGAIVSHRKPAGTEIITTVWHKAADTEKQNAYMRMTLGGTNYDVYATSTGEWETLSVIGTTTAASQGARIWFVSDAADVNKLYFDDLTVQVLTEELALAFIEEKLAQDAPNSTEIATVLLSKALGLTQVDSELMERYVTTLKATRSEASAALTKEQVQACIAAVNFETLIDSMDSLDTLEIGVTGSIAIPVTLPNGVTAKWTAVSPAGEKITVSDGAATVTAVPGDQDPAEYYDLTLSLTCGTETEDVTVKVKLINNAELSGKLLNETVQKLLASGTVLGIDSTNAIALPQGYDFNGVSAVWSDIKYNPENRLSLNDGVLAATSLPSGKNYVEATAVLKLTKDSAEDTIEYTLVIYDPTEHILLDMPNPSFEVLDDDGYAVGWAPHNAATDYIYTKIATDVGRTGTNSLVIHDTQPKQSTGAKYKTATIPVEVGYDYVATVWAKGTGSGGGIIYLYFYKDATTNNKSYATNFGDFPVNEETWVQASVRGNATTGSVYINIMPYSNQVGVGTTYYDDFRVWKITAAGILAEIEAELTAAEGNAETLYARLDNGALTVGALVDTNKARYLSELKALRETKGSALTDAELKAYVEQINATVTAEDQQLVNNAVAEIPASMTVSNLGIISVPQITTQGVDLAWSALAGDTNRRILLTATSARTVSLPAISQSAEQVTLTLKVSRGQISTTVNVAVTLNPLTETISSLADAANALKLSDFLNGQNPAYITEDLATLPSTLGDGISVTWKALNTNRLVASSAMTDDGKVTRPECGEADVPVLLQATFEKNGESHSVEYFLLVAAQDADDARTVGHWDSEFEVPYTDATAVPNGWLKTDLYKSTNPVVKSEVAEITNTQVFIGNNALLLTTGDNTGELRSEFDLTAREGFLYKLQAMTYIETSGNPTITLSFWDNEGLLLSSATAKYLDSSKDAGVWKNLSVSGIAPVGTVAVTATLTGVAGEVFFDNIRLREYPNVTNSSFDLGTVGWTTDGTVNNGTLTLTAGQTASSNISPAVAGLPYVLRIQGTGNATLRFLKGAEILQDYTTTSGKIYAYAPVGADGFQVLLSGAAAVESVYVVNGAFGTTVADGTFEFSASANNGTPWQLSHAVIGSQSGMDGTAGVTVQAGGTAYSNPIPIIEGKDYIVSADVFGSGSIELQYYTIGNTGGQVDGKTVANSNSGWNHLVLDAAQFSDGTQDYATEYVVIALHANGGEARFDNVQIKTVTTSVSNSSAETVLRGGYGTFATHWEAFGPGIAYMANQKSEATEGFKSIALELFGFGEAGIRSSLIKNIKPGAEYEATVQAKGNGAELAIEFLDADMNRLSIKTVKINSANWAEYSVIAEAPENAAYAVLGVMGSGEGKVFIDEGQIVPVVKDIESNTQLFLDDYMIESSTNVDRVYHDGTKYTNENGDISYVYPGAFGSYAQIYGTVLFDDDRTMFNEPNGEKGIYRMWYQSASYRTSYAESRDGITWIAPELNLATISGSKENNICNIKGTSNPSISVFAVFKDEDEIDPNKLYKMVTHNRQHSAGVGWYELWFSPDGLTWEFYDNIILGHDVASVFYDEANDLYIGTFKNTLNTKRVHHITVSEDLINWSQPIPMGTIDTLQDSEHFLRTDSYGYGGTAIGDTYVGFNWRFLINEGTMGGIADVVLMYSRDPSEDWQRMYHPNGESVLAVPLGEDGTFDDGFIDTASTSINVGDETWLYYGGWDGDHLGGIVRTAKIGLVKWRLNGFGSMNFGGTEGTLETSKFTFTGSELHVNAKINGSLKIELLNQNGAVVDTAEITGDKVDHVVTWKNGTNLGYMEGQTVSLRFTGTDAELYTFEIKGDSVQKPTVTVTFDSGVAQQELSYGESVIKPADPSKTGYTFAGWYNGETAYDFNSAVTGNLTLTAKWEINKYTISFGDDATAQTVDHGAKATKPADPSKTGYTFAGWFNGETAYDFNTAVTGNVTLTAKWVINQYTVTFDSGVAAQTVEYGAKATKPADPTKTGYTFAGWYNGETAYNFNTAVTDNVTLTAKWTIDEYTVAFDSGVEAQLVKHGSKATKPADPSKTGYTFVGWFNGETAYDFNTAVTGNVTLTAKWVINKYTVTFDSGVAAQTVEYGAKATKPADPTKAGFTFAGWYNGETAYDFNTAVTGAITLTAKWTIDEYTVAFDSGVTAQMVKHGSKATKPADPTKTGYTFVGWYNGETAYDFNTAVTGNVTLTAKWVINKYTVTFDSGVATQTVEYGAKATKPADPTKEGFVFAGWYKGETAYDFNTAVTGSITLTAKWVEKITIPVSGDENTIHVNVAVEDDVVTIQPIAPEELDKVVGEEVQTGNVVIDLTELDTEVESVVLPQAAVQQILEAAKESGNDTESLIIKLPEVTVELDDKTMHEITDTAEGDVALSVELIAVEDLNTEQKKALEDKKTFSGIDISLVCTESGEKVTDFNGGKVTMKVPFEVPANHKANGFSVWYVAEDGKLTKMTTKYEDGHLVFETGHFSDYIIIYEEPAPEGEQPGGNTEPGTTQPGTTTPGGSDEPSKTGDEALLLSVLLMAALSAAALAVIMIGKKKLF